MMLLLLLVQQQQQCSDVMGKAQHNNRTDIHTHTHNLRFILVCLLVNTAALLHGYEK